MVEVKLYTKSYCPYCHAALALFKEKNIEVENIEVDDKPDIANKIKEQTSHKTFPQIFINEKFIGGFDDLVELEESKELDELLS